MRLLFTFFVMLFISSFILHGQIIHVPQDQATIQAALDYSSDHDTILVAPGEDSIAVLQGFTITGGKGTRWEDEHGANHWYTEGGGILIQYSSPTIKYNIITWNEAINIPSGTTSAGGGGIR